MPKYYEFEVSLNWIEPRIWRRFLLNSELTFLELHQAIQKSFGWQGHHLWEFQNNDSRRTPLAGLFDDSGWGPPTPDAVDVTLESYFGGKRGKRVCGYVYDFGDDWQHKVKRGRTHDLDETFERRLLAGERAAPGEDSGGYRGYERRVHFVKTGEDLYNNEGTDLKSWLGDWDPEFFDLETMKAEFDR